MSAENLLLLALIWCAAQLALFVTLRVLRPVRSEGAIFLLHVAAFVGFTLVAAASYVLWPDISATVAVGAVSLNAIYCLSFLELWSLAEGGYSIGMLKSLKQRPQAREQMAEAAAAVGDRKRENRIQALQDLALVSDEAGTFTLTPRGRLVAVGHCAAAGARQLPEPRLMALAIAVLTLLAAVLIHALVMRLSPPLGSVAAFVAVAFAGAVALAAILLRQMGIAAETIAALLTYAFGCELYLFLSTFSLASISSNILAELRQRSLSEEELAHRYASERMARLRIERLLAAGLIEEKAGTLSLTPKGARTVRIFERLRALFGH